MKQLYIIRHGDSPIINGGDDFDRPLSEMGRYDAINIGLHLNEGHPLPTCVISSAATRAITTARIIADELEFDTTKIIAKKELHNASMNTVMEELTQVPKSTECAMIFGHNPGISELAFHLTGENFYMDTCNVVLLNLEIDSWEELIQGCGELDKYIAP